MNDPERTLSPPECRIDRECGRCGWAAGYDSVADALFVGWDHSGIDEWLCRECVSDAMEMEEE